MYEGRLKARVGSLFAEMESCTLQPGEDPEVFFARLYRWRLQLQQVSCTVDAYQPKANALSGLSAECIPTLSQLRTMQSLGLTVVNEMLREVYVNDIFPKKAKNPPRGYRSKAAMTTTSTAKLSGRTRDISEFVCHNGKVKGHYAHECLARNTLPGDTTTKWCSLHKTRSNSDNVCMAQQATPQSTPPVPALPATVSPATETCLLTFVKNSSFSFTKKDGLQLMFESGCSSYMVDPETIPNADQYLREYQALQPPQIVNVAGSHELFATGTAKLTIGVENTAGKQRQMNMSGMLVPGLGRNLLFRQPRQQAR